MLSAGRSKPPAFVLYHLFWQMLDWLYPPTCGSCQKQGVRWCEKCHEGVVPISGNFCPICGQPQNNEDICRDCQLNPPAYTALRSYSGYKGTLREGIHSLKYKKDIGLGEILASYLIEAYVKFDWQVDLITAVPLSRKRILTRGYNQAAMLAFPLALYYKIPYQPYVLKRIRETPTQVGLNGSERRQNVLGAFKANSGKVSGKSILVVDDVTTTGATIQACSQALLDAGAAAVYGLTLARAGLHTDLLDLQAVQP